MFAPIKYLVYSTFLFHQSYFFAVDISLIEHQLKLVFHILTHPSTNQVSFQLTAYEVSPTCLKLQKYFHLNLGLIQYLWGIVSENRLKVDIYKKIHKNQLHRNYHDCYYSKLYLVTFINSNHKICQQEIKFKEMATGERYRYLKMTKQ